MIDGNFQFGSPWLLSLLLAIPSLLFWKWWRRSQSRPPSLRFADVTLVRPLSGTPLRFWRVRLQPLLPTLRLLALALAVIALARPQIIQTRQTIYGEGVDIALALDISGSMAALDMSDWERTPQNRLEAAKEVIDAFIQEREYDRLGLVVFAQNAFNQSPPTTDHNAFLRVLEQAQLATDLQIADGTAIGMGLANAANMLKSSAAKSKIIILLTDGVSNFGQIDPVTAAEAAKTIGIKVYTIGMGRPGQVPVAVKDGFGREFVQMQESILDEGTLQKIAEITEGRYYRAMDKEALQEIYDEINELEKSEIEIQSYTRYQELMGWVLGPTLALLLVEMLLRHTVFRKVP